MHKFLLILVLLLLFVTSAKAHKGIIEYINNPKLVGIYNKNKRSIIFDKNKKIGEENDPDFGKWFFDIWLSEKNLYPKLHKQLLGRK